MSDSSPCSPSTLAHSFAIDEHLELQQDEADTKAMFARERRNCERYNCCVAEDAAMPVGSFFADQSDKVDYFEEDS